MIKTIIKHASGRSTIPIIGQICVMNGVMTTTNMDDYISGPCDLPDGMYHTHGFDKGMQIKSTLPVTDFPEFRMLQKDKNPTAQAKTVLHKEQIENLKWVLEAASKEAVRYYLNGVYFDWRDEQAIVVATDGHRLHSFKHEIEAKRPTGKKKKQDDGKFKTIIPPAGAIMSRQSVKLILSLVKELASQKVEIEFSGLQFTARVGVAVIKGNLIDGTFPEWRLVVPDYEKCTNFDAEQVKAIIPEMEIIKRIGMMGKTLAVVVENKSIRNGYNIEGIKKSWPCCVEWDLRAGFNLKYLAALCSGVMYYKDESCPFKVIDSRGAIERMAVIMPMRV